MSLKDYLEDHIGFLVTCFLFLMLESFLLLLLGVEISMVVMLGCVWAILFIGYFVLSFHRKEKRMKELEQMLNQLDQKYLLHEVMGSGGNSEEQFYRYLLRMGNKSMLEHVSGIERTRKDYQEYIEQWVHEIKTPIAAMKLWAENQEGKKKREAYTQVERIEHYVEQALFYARSENVEKDFCIQKMDIKEVVQEALLQCKYLCTSNGIHVDIPEESYWIRSDEKWIVFLLNQLIENAVKYRRSDIDSTLSIFIVEKDDEVELHVKDNGIGICANDIARIFEKGFTGENGRNANRHATGIGLYLCKKLCHDLGIDIDVVSSLMQGCDMILSFPSYNSVREL